MNQVINFKILIFKNYQKIFIKVWNTKNRIWFKKKIKYKYHNNKITKINIKLKIYYNNKSLNQYKYKNQIKKNNNYRLHQIDLKN